MFAEPVYVEPTYMEPAYVDPAHVQPAYVEPTYVEPTYVEPVSLAPTTTEIGGWEPGFTVIAPDDAWPSATVLTNAPISVPAYDPGLSLSEALASPTFGGSPWDTSVYQVYNQSSVAFPTLVRAPAWNAYSDPLTNGALAVNELALLNIRIASRPIGS
jgi:hypothetical protein